MAAPWIDFTDYHPRFQRIQAEFGFSQSKEVEARNLLHSYRQSMDPKRVIQAIQDSLRPPKKIIFFGAGPALPQQLRDLFPVLRASREQFFLVAADGAANAFTEAQKGGIALENGIVPDLIVSDLDGLTPRQFEYFDSQGVATLVLAHGDNFPQIRAVEGVLQTSDHVIGATQIEARYPIIRPGGFTDGDRGLFFLHHLAPLELPFYLVGYAFGEKIGRFSKPSFQTDAPMTPTKARKLEICRESITYLEKEGGRTILFMGVNFSWDDLT